MSARVLVVNADDFGLTPGVDRGIARGYDEGIVTSASLMVLAPDAPDAARCARARPGLAVGLHVDLGEWSYARGEWICDRAVVELDDEVAVRSEIERQLVAFGALMGREPTHLDSHQHVHRSDPVRTILLERATDLGVPLRGFDARIAHCGAFHGQDGRGRSYPELVSVRALADIVGTLAAGWTELGCHPGEVDDGLVGPYRRERERELAALCDERLPVLLDQHGVALASFADLATL